MQTDNSNFNTGSSQMLSEGNNFFNFDYYRMDQLNEKKNIFNIPQTGVEFTEHNELINYDDIQNVS